MSSTPSPSSTPRPGRARRTGRFLLRRVLPVVLVAVAAVLVWAFWPESVADEVAGLDDVASEYDVTITRDTWGVPHVRGPTDPDVAYGLAYAHAEDDFLTIQQSALAARGDLARIYGPDAAPNDYMVGLLRVWDQVDAGYPTLTPDARALVEAYADGLNHYAAEHPDEVLAGLFPVSGRDVVAASVHKSPLFFGLEQTLAELFADGPLELTRHRTDAVQPAGVATPGSSALGDLRHGSNTVAVAPTRSTDGATRLLVNSHQPWSGPVAWYEAVVESADGWHAAGALFPGVPAIVHGHNEDLGWAFTVNHPDLVDVYELDVDPDDPMRYRVDGEWLELESRTVPIEVRLLGERLRWTVEREALWSIHGPTVRREDGTFAVRYAGMDTVGIFEQLYRMNRAADFDEWYAALATQEGLPTFNVGYADGDGRIAYVYNAMLPDREPGYDWAGIVPGDTRATLWEDYLPFDELPQVVDPPAGFVQNANSSPFTATLGAGNPDPGDFPADTTGVERFETNRSTRLRELLGADDAISGEEFLTIKWDRTYAPIADVAAWRDRLVELAPAEDADDRRALELLADWDLVAAVDRPGATVALVAVTFLAEDEDVELNPGRLVGHEVGDDDLVDAFRSAVDWLVEHHETVEVPWGEVNRLVRGDVDLPLGGGPETVRAVYGERHDDGTLHGIVGDSYVQVVTWDEAGDVSSHSVHQFGSATLDEDSPHFADQAEPFADEELTPVRFDAEDLAGHVEVSYRPGERPAD